MTDAVTIDEVLKVDRPPDISQAHWERALSGLRAFIDGRPWRRGRAPWVAS
jgi:hypothetical protein